MSRNLCPVNDLTFENSQQIKFEIPLAAGTYTSSAVVSSTDTDSAVCLMLFYYADGNTKEVYINRSKNGERVSKTAEFTQEVTRVRIYASEGYSMSVGDTGTFSKLQIEAGSQMTEYVPYGEEEMLSDWDDPQTEIGKYYKALAGGNIEPPEPSCRETMLLKKLLDSTYTVPFENKHTSIVESYLWDLINGTAEMLTNTPQSDVEKYLHVMLGGTVENMPIVDCERNYWMNKYIEKMK